MTEKKEDRRVRRTKKLLTQGLTELLQLKPVQDITVRELAERVDVNRGTFYLYYRDIFDMLAQIEEDLFSKFDQIIISHKDDVVISHSLPFLQDLFSFVQENHEMCAVLLGEHGDMAFLQRLNHVVHEKCMEDWQRLRQPCSPEEFNYRYDFVVFGCIGLIRTWVTRQCKESAVNMAALANEMILRGSISLEIA